MEGESKKALKYLADQPASVHNYGKLSRSESRRTHSSPTSILRKLPHSLRHDQKHQTKLKPGSPGAKGKTADEGEEEEGGSAEAWFLGDEEPHEEKDRDEDFRRKRKLSAGSAASECSSDGDVWKLRWEVQGKSVQSERLSGKTIKKLSVINNNSYEDSEFKFPEHKSTPDLLRCESSVSGLLSHPESVADRSSENRVNRGGVLKTYDSLPHLDQRYKIIHSILPKINRAISESHESLKKRSPDHFCGSGRIFDVGGKSDGSQSEDDENEGLIDGRRHAIVQSGKERKESKSRWPYKKTADIMPGLRSLVGRRARGGGGEGEEALPPRAAAPLVPPKSESSSSVDIPEIRCSGEGEDEEASVKKCDTVYALANLIRADPSLQVEPIKPINRLRVPPNGAFGNTSRMCSRCSSLLSMASSSRYSINTTGSGFVNCSSAAEKPPEPLILCKLCLMEVPDSMSVEINNCGCIFCKDCMRLYVEFEIQEGAYDISCPDAQCARQGVVSLEEVEALVAARMMERYLRFRLNREVDMDRNRTWCPRAGCETVCDVCPREKCAPTSVHCPTCNSDFCSNCKNTWHKGLTCEENSKKLAKEGRSDFAEPGIPFDSDSIKCCPMCNVPIEKDEGCAQMMCKRCKHVFCWYCLASLDDDFLLRHYDKGPCKNKLGHSRASVIWHRTQVIGIFAGLGLLLLVASPLLLLAAPCIVCCKCRVCSGTKLDAEDDLPEDSGT